MFPSLSETGFFVGGFNWFVDWLVFPISMLGLRLFPQTARKPLRELMKWGLTTFSKPPYGTALKVEARGEKESKDKAVNVSIYHEDGYMLTAIPVVACLLQYLDGSLRKPGLWTQANIVEPNRLIADMERIGVDVHIEGDYAYINTSVNEETREISKLEIVDISNKEAPETAGVYELDGIPSNIWVEDDIAYINTNFYDYEEKEYGEDSMLLIIDIKKIIKEVKVSVDTLSLK